MRLLLGIDGGGTKTQAILCDEAGCVLRAARVAATNPTSVAESAVVERLSALLGRVLEDYGGLSAEVEGCFGGFGGGGLPQLQAFLGECLASLLPGARHLANGSDAVNILNSGLGLGNGIALIAGTGSSAFTRIEGTLRLITGWGYLFGDEGSGYSLGRHALISALRAYDGRGEQTLLLPLCEEKLGSSIEEAIPLLYREGRALIASFAPLMLRAYHLGDAVAAACVAQVLGALAEAALAAGRRFPEDRKPMVIAGGLFDADPLFAAGLRDRLPDAYAFISPALPPVYGAVLEAARRASIPVDAGFAARFAQSFQERE